MAHELPDGFIPKYFEELKLRGGEQKMRRLGGMATQGGKFTGDDAYFPRVGSAETTKASRLQELLNNQLPLDWIKTSAEPEFVNFTIWDPDKNKLTFDMASVFAAASARAIGRAQDRQVVDALNAAATSGVTNTKGVTENIITIGDYDTVADLETFCQAFVLQGEQEMFAGEKVTVIEPFRMMANLSLDPYMAKTDVKTQQIWNQADWRTYERLPGNATTPVAGAGWVGGGATGVDIYVVAHSAIAEAINDNPTDINERLGSRVGDMIGAWFQSACAVTEAKGLIRIKSKIDFSLLRRATPTFETNPDAFPA